MLPSSDPYESELISCGALEHLMIVVDRSGLVINASDTVSRLATLSKSQIIGRTLYSFYSYYSYILVDRMVSIQSYT